LCKWKGSRKRIDFLPGMKVWSVYRNTNALFFFSFHFSFNNFISVLFRFTISCNMLTDDDWQWYLLITFLDLFMLMTNPMDYKTALSHCRHTICNNVLHCIHLQVSPLGNPMIDSGTSC
jgi:hypothetical protein